MSIKVIPMVDADVEEVAAFMAESFAQDPLYCYFVPDEQTRMEFMKGFFAFRLRYTINFGKVYITEDKKAVSAWVEPGAQMQPEHLVMFGGQEPFMIVVEDVVNRVMAFSEFGGKIEAEFAPMPHWHWGPLAVDSAYWGKGYAKALMQGMFTYLDENGEFCYLETQTEKNKEIYEKYGFEVIKQDVLPGTNIPHFSMLRAPKGK